MPRLTFLSLFMLLAFVLAGIVIPPANAGSPQARENKIRAGLVYYFIKSTQWPPSVLPPTSPIYLCVIGQAPFGGYLNFLDSRIANKREIVVRHIKNDSMNELCHALIVPEKPEENDEMIYARAATENILTISSRPGFTKEGGMVEIFKKRDTMALKVNTEAVIKAGLTMQRRMVMLSEKDMDGGSP